MILFECDADETLLKFLLDELPEKEFEHKHGKGNVLKWIFKTEDSIGLVDRDQDSHKLGYYNQLEELDFSNHFRYSIFTAPNGNKIVELEPRLEEWLLRVAKLEGSDLNQHRLSSDVNRFKNQINLNPKKLKNLLETLVDSEHIQKLREVLIQII